RVPTRSRSSSPLAPRLKILLRELRSIAPFQADRVAAIAALWQKRGILSTEPSLEAEPRKTPGPGAAQGRTARARATPACPQAGRSAGRDPAAYPGSRTQRGLRAA